MTFKLFMHGQKISTDELDGKKSGAALFTAVLECITLSVTSAIMSF